MTRAQLIIHSDDRRSGDRHSLAAAATVREVDATPLDVTLLDLSTTGCMIETVADLGIGASVSVGVVGLPVTHGIVVRRDGHRYGCRFSKPVDLAAVRVAGGTGNIYAMHLPARLPTPGDEARQQKLLPVQARVAIIVSTSIALWAGIIMMGIWIFG